MNEEVLRKALFHRLSTLLGEWDERPFREGTAERDAYIEVWAGRLAALTPILPTGDARANLIQRLQKTAAGWAEAGLATGTASLLREAAEALSAQSPPPADDARRLWDAIRSEAPNGEMAGVQVHPNGDWDVIKPDRVAYVGDRSQPPPPIMGEGRGFDAAVAAIESWADGFIGPSDTANLLRLTAKDLRRNRDTILALFTKQPKLK